MQLHPLNQLRLAFIALGAALALPLGWLMSAAEERIEAQRRLRHEVVAERIFDELERELTRVLREESLVPSHSYDASWPSSAWAPYVVGYFTTDGRATRLLEAEQLSPDRKRRLEVVLGREELTLTSLGAGQDKAGSLPVRQGVPQKARAGSSSPAEVLRQLNRAKDERSAPQEQKGNY